MSRGRKYKMVPFTEFNFKKINRKRAGLNSEKAKARENMRLAITKLNRLNKIKRYFAQRKARMVEKGFSNVEKIKRWKAEKKRQKTVAGFSTSQLATPGFNFNFFEADFAEMAFLSPSFLKTLVFNKTSR